MTHQHVREFGLKDENDKLAVIAYVPMVAPPNQRRQLDTLREVYGFNGILDWMHEVGGLYKNQGHLHAHWADASTRNPHLFVHVDSFKYPPQAKDCVKMVIKGREAGFEITDVQRDGESGVVLELTQIGEAF